MLLAQLSDTHLLDTSSARLRGRNTAETLAAVLDAFPRRPDVAVFTGDLAEAGARGAYVQIRSLAAEFADEVHHVPGNHDDPVAMASVLGAWEPVRSAPLSRGWTLLLIDSQWVGCDAGRVEEEALARLEEELAHAEGHVVVGLHHPPVSPCDREDCGMVEPERLIRAFGSGPVRVVLSGHVHRQFDTTVGGVRYLGAPSTFRQPRHGGVLHYNTTTEPPAAFLVELHPDGTVTPRVVTAR